MVTMSDWLSSYEALPSVGIRKTCQVEGTCKRVMGARSLFARVALEFSPAAGLEFETVLSDQEKRMCEAEGWLKAICLGVLDVTLVQPVTPINGFRCVIEKVEYHPVDSSRQAFRLAARQAAEELLRAKPLLSP
jgi:translation elongation factor EF-G